MAFVAEMFAALLNAEAVGDPAAAAECQACMLYLVTQILVQPAVLAPSAVLNAPVTQMLGP
jgi:hypothetical protein